MIPQLTTLANCLTVFVVIVGPPMFLPLLAYAVEMVWSSSSRSNPARNP